jgi:transcriptional regulator with XRE-family HTH domain
VPIRKSHSSDGDKDAARQRYNDPAVQKRLRRTKDAAFRERSLLPSQVFAYRLRDTREARGLKQTELARQTAATGNPISQPTLSRIETGKQGISLDEAFALTEVLRAVPAHMLTPPSPSLVRLSEAFATDGSGLRAWLVSGLPHRSDQAPPEEIAGDVAQDRHHRNLVRLAFALVDAMRLDSEQRGSAMNEAAKAIGEEVARRKREQSGRRTSR